MRMEPYISRRLSAGSLSACQETVRTVMSNIDAFLGIIAQSYGDLDEARTSELKLMDLKQQGAVPEYLTRFMQYAFNVT